MGKLLFSSGGRINQEKFYKGAVILLAINFFGWLAWFGGLAAGMLASLFSLVLIYCWGCLFAKRLHDAGKSGYLYLVLLLIFIVISWLMGALLMGIFTPEVVDFQVELQEISSRKTPTMDDVVDMFNLIERMYVMTAIPKAISFLLSGALIAFGVNAKLRSDPNDNQYGPAA